MASFALETYAFRNRKQVIMDQLFVILKLVLSFHKVVQTGISTLESFLPTPQFFLNSNTNAARSRNALNSLICFSIPPESVFLLTSSATRFNSTSVPVILLASLGCKDFPRSTANSISWTVTLSASLSYLRISAIACV